MKWEGPCHTARENLASLSPIQKGELSSGKNTMD